MINKDIFIESNMKEINQIVDIFMDKTVERDDLFQVVCMGIVRGINRYETKGSTTSDLKSNLKKVLNRDVVNFLYANFLWEQTRLPWSNSVTEAVAMTPRAFDNDDLFKIVTPMIDTCVMRYEDALLHKICS